MNFASRGWIWLSKQPVQESSELTKGLHGKLGGLLQKAEDWGRDPRRGVVFFLFAPDRSHGRFLVWPGES